MPLICEDLCEAEQSAINNEIKKLSLEYSLRVECMDGRVDVTRSCNTLIYHSAAGFYFFNMPEGASLYDALLMDVKTPRKYLCSAFIVDGGSDTVIKMKERFQEVYGEKLANKTDSVLIHRGGDSILLVKFPSEIVRCMMCENGGVLKTVFKGSAASLRNIHSLARYVPLPDDGLVHSVFATGYTEGQYNLVRALHYKIMQEVVVNGGLGICLSFVGTWDSYVDVT